MKDLGQGALPAGGSGAGALCGGRKPRKKHHPLGLSKRSVSLIPGSPVLPGCSKGPGRQGSGQSLALTFGSAWQQMTVPLCLPLSSFHLLFESTSSLKAPLPGSLPSISQTNSVSPFSVLSWDWSHRSEACKRFCCLPLCHCISQNMFLGSQSEFPGEVLKVQTTWIRFSSGGWGPRICLS